MSVKFILADKTALVGDAKLVYQNSPFLKMLIQDCPSPMNGQAEIDLNVIYNPRVVKFIFIFMWMHKQPGWEGAYLGSLPKDILFCLELWDASNFFQITLLRSLLSKHIKNFLEQIASKQLFRELSRA